MKNENPVENMSDNRRDFLKKSALVGMGVLLSPVTNAVTSSVSNSEANMQGGKGVVSKKQTVTILITTDIHSQLNTHDEFF
ncbi:MAG: twin-arginine translocation signal domain-containing protein, partial [Bacteroidia bacterium]|nr:twin-arginine translocation signal domain-containing protein [Bacteroidia bacterium]